MGDQAGIAVSGTLQYVPFDEFERVRAIPAADVTVARLFATLCRINALYMIARAGSGHIGSSFSSLDLMTWLLLREVRSGAAPGEPVDTFFSSKGHDAPALYSIMLGLGRLDFEWLHQLRRLGGLPGHPDVATPGIVTNTGSLGMGISKAKGMVFAQRTLGRSGNVFVLTGDGELQEGQLWESLVSAANHRLHELCVVVDHNKMQSDTLVTKVSDLGDLEAKFTAFGWHVARCDGNDIEAVAATFRACRDLVDRPKVIIADTIKGKGVSFMEHTSIDSDVEFYKFHSGAPSESAYVRAADELLRRANRLLDEAGAAALRVESVTRAAAVAAAATPQRLVQAYSNALIQHARVDRRIVALDADLVLDTGLIPFQQEFPERFVECGIAEQDMVSQAGGMALRGLLPVVHSFACFLSARPNEQIYNNATERTKIVYVGSLAGLAPGGPGHSHQAVRDISALGAIPGLVLAEPSCESEVRLLLDWCLNVHPGSSYLRLVSLPWSIPYELPADHRPVQGRGVVLREGGDVAIIGYGPILLSAAYEAARQLELDGIRVQVINLPWLNTVDADWLEQVLGPIRQVVSLDNHYRIGGQGDRIANALAGGSGPRRQLHRFALDDVPVCGTNAEVLRYHGLDAESLVVRIRACVKAQESWRRS